MKNKSLLKSSKTLGFSSRTTIGSSLTRLPFLAISMFLIITQLAYSHHIVARIPVIDNPLNMALEDDVLYVSNLSEREISIIDTVSNSYSDGITTSGGVVAVQPIQEKNKIYVATFESGGIDVHDLTTGLYQKTIELPESKIYYPEQLADRLTEEMNLASGGASLAYDAKTDLLYVANYNANNVVVINTDSDTAEEVIPVARHPIDIKVDPISSKLLVISLAGNVATFISLDNHEVIKEISVGTGPWGVAIDEIDHKAYVTHRGSDNIAILDMVTNELVGEIPISEKGTRYCG